MRFSTPDPPSGGPSRRNVETALSDWPVVLEPAWSEAWSRVLLSCDRRTVRQQTWNAQGRQSTETTLYRVSLGLVMGIRPAAGTTARDWLNRAGLSLVTTMLQRPSSVPARITNVDESDKINVRFDGNETSHSLEVTLRTSPGRWQLSPFITRAEIGREPWGGVEIHIVGRNIEISSPLQLRAVPVDNYLAGRRRLRD